MSQDREGRGTSGASIRRVCLAGEELEAADVPNWVGTTIPSAILCASHGAAKKRTPPSHHGRDSPRRSNGIKELLRIRQIMEENLPV